MSKTLSTKTLKIVAQFALAGLTLSELGAQLAAAVAADGVTTRKEAHADVVNVLLGYPAYAVDIQSTGYFVGGSAGQQAYSRVMRAAFPSGATAAQKKVVRVPAALRAAMKALLAEGYTTAQIKECLK